MTIERRALLSVSDKSGLVPFAKGLRKLGFELISTGGTLAHLRKEAISAYSVTEFTGFPEILDGRVKTLHPGLFAGILARRDVHDHILTLEEMELPSIDLVVVNLYPFQATVASDPAAFDTCLEKIDIGGPSLLRAAAKTFRDVMPVVDPNDYDAVLAQIEREEGPELGFRQELARKVFGHISKYDAAISGYLGEYQAPATPGERVEREGGELDESALPANLQINVCQSATTQLKYGENPHQSAALYADPYADEPSLPGAELLQGKALGYNNFCDGEAALEMVKEALCLVADWEKRRIAGEAHTAVAIVKHANPCGLALGASPREAYERALACDPVSAFGGIVAFAHEVDLAAAEAMTGLKIDVIVAPSFSDEAREKLKKKKTTRLLKTGALPGPMPKRLSFRNIVGGVVAQEFDRFASYTEEWKVVTERQPSAEELQGLEFAWLATKWVKSNAIVYSSTNATLGIGAGQMSRVDSAKFGAIKAADAGLSLEGCCLASDAFFPFRDGVDVAAKAGVKAIIQPGGSIRDEETIAAANEHGITMIFTGRRHFRH